MTDRRHYPEPMTPRDMLRREMRERLDAAARRRCDDLDTFWTMDDAAGGPMTLAHRVEFGRTSDAGEWCDWEWILETSEEAHALVTIRCAVENGPREFVTYAVRADNLAASAGFVVGLVQHAFRFGPRESAEILLPDLPRYGAWIVKVSR